MESGHSGEVSLAVQQRAEKDTSYANVLVQIRLLDMMDTFVPASPLTSKNV